MTIDETIQTLVDGITLLAGILPVVALSAYLFGITWMESIKPRLIPHRTVEREADEIIATFSDPLREISRLCERQWYGDEQWKAVYWSRVRKVVRRRMEKV